MMVLPALDLRRGYCVRLYQGDPEKETVYGSDPAGVARQWEELGAKMLHIVDLDGAFSGSSINAAAINDIYDAVEIPFQLGGGIRSVAAVDKALETGASRVIVGTAAVEQPGMAEEMVQVYGQRLVVGIDAREGMVAVKGWKEASSMTARELACRVEQWGAKEIIYTDTQRDGTLCGPNLQGLEDLLEATSLRIIMSGGIGSREHLVALRAYAGRVSGVIMGKALYDNRITFLEAVEALNGNEKTT